MDSCKSSEPIVKKSLMNVLERLERKARHLRELADFSDQVIGKLNNPRPQPEPNGEGMDKKVCVELPALDLIDLFIEVADKLEVATNRIGSNVEKVNSIIE